MVLCSKYKTDNAGRPDSISSLHCLFLLDKRRIPNGKAIRKFKQTIVFFIYTVTFVSCALSLRVDQPLLTEASKSKFGYYSSLQIQHKI
jgi:hypothetical protein